MTACVPSLAAAIAYCTVFSLPPLLVLLVGLAGGTSSEKSMESYTLLRLGADMLVVLFTTNDRKFYRADLTSSSRTMSPMRSKRCAHPAAA